MPITQTLFYSFNAVAPLCLIMALGYVLKQRGIMDAPFLKGGNALVFKILLPVMLFENTRKFENTGGFDWQPVAFSLAAILVLYFIYWAVVARTVKDSRDKGVMVQGLVRGNFVVYGTPLCVNLFGDNAEVRALTGIVAALVVSLYNLISVVVLEYYGTGGAAGRERVLQTVKKIATNPLILGAFLGVACSFLKTRAGVDLPLSANRALAGVSAAATPIALLFLGGEFQFGFLSRYWKQAAIVNGVREVLAAALVVATAVALGFRGLELGVVVCVFGAPVAVSSYPMAKMSGGNADLAAALVVTTTLFSCLSIFGIIAVLKALGLL